MNIDYRLFNAIMNRPLGEEFLFDIDKQKGYIIGKPQVDFKIDANIDRKKKCASLSIQFKLFFK